MACDLTDLKKFALAKPHGAAKIAAVGATNPACVEAKSALLCTAVPQVLEAALDEYKQRHADENTDPDEMILSAGDYLLRVLEPVQQQRIMRKYILLGTAGACSVLTAGMLIGHLWSRDSSGKKGSGGSSSGGSIQPQSSSVGSGGMAAAGSGVSIANLAAGRSKVQ